MSQCCYKCIPVQKGVNIIKPLSGNTTTTTTTTNNNNNNNKNNFFINTTIECESQRSLKLVCVSKGLHQDPKYLANSITVAVR